MTFWNEENKEREEAVKSTASVAQALPDKVFQDQYVEMVSRLATKEWFTARMSACCLIANSFRRLTPERQVCLSIFHYFFSGINKRSDSRDYAIMMHS